MAFNIPEGVMTDQNNSAHGAACLSELPLAVLRRQRRHIAPQALSMADLKKEGDVACLYHCDYGDNARFAQTLNNISNHYSAYGADPFGLQLVIIAHSAAVKYFLSTLEGTPWKDETIDPALFERVIALAKNGLKVYLCEITFQR
jgi:intracellular sulfur oxidation DsrE/DsrF family protein